MDELTSMMKGHILVCKRRKGQPRPPTDPMLVRRIINESKSPTDHAPDEYFYSVAFNQPYLPCIRSVTELKPTTLFELRIGAHHRDHMLILERVTPVVQNASSSSAVAKDIISGETDLLQLYVHTRNRGGEFLEACKVFVLKDPYFTLDKVGTPMLLIHHQSDIVLVQDKWGNVNIDINNALPASPVIPDRSPTQCKEDGNKALKRKNLRSAYASYTQGLQILNAAGPLTASDDRLRRDLHRNRAYINLFLQRYDEARSDALTSLSSTLDSPFDKLNGKAWFRAAQAAYGLGDFMEAAVFFSHQLKHAPDDKETKQWLRQSVARCLEHQSAVYDYKGIARALSKAHPRCDVADYTEDTEIRPSPGKGRGLFATKDIRCGDVIICEKAFRTVLGHAPDFFHILELDVRDQTSASLSAGLWREVYQKLLDNPSQIKKVLDLHSKGYQGIGKKPLVVDGQPVLDAFHIHHIVANNSTGIQPIAHGELVFDENVKAPYKMSSGLWVRTSLTNHSCLPNSGVSIMRDLKVLTASKPIKKGEEITVCYPERTLDYDARTSVIENIWQFECTCRLCIAEKSDSAEVRDKREELLSAAKNLVKGKRSDKATKMKLQWAEHLAKEMAKTYDETKYANLPRLALSPLLYYIADNHDRLAPNDRYTVTKNYTAYLRSLNFKVSTTPDGSRITGVEGTELAPLDGRSHVNMMLALNQLVAFVQQAGDSEGEKRLTKEISKLHSVHSDALPELVCKVSLLKARLMLEMKGPTLMPPLLQANAPLAIEAGKCLIMM